MENVTHSLIGVVIGEGILWARRRRRRRQFEAAAGGQASAVVTGGQSDDLSLRAGVFWAAVLGSNMPDSDVLLHPIVGGGNLGSLLHHRGFTHTLALSPLMAVLAALFGAGASWGVRRRFAQSLSTQLEKPSWTLMLATGWIGALGHLFADFWNNYGVHPFWPVDSSWVYGDLIFILEPLFWLSLLPFAFFLTRDRFLKGFSVFLALFVLALVWSLKFTGWPVALWITIWGAGWTAWHAMRARRAGRPVWSHALLAIVAVLTMFALGRGVARGRILERVPEGETLLGLSTSPAPANPLCWQVILTTTRDEAPDAGSRGAPGEGGQYVARMGALSLGGSDPNRCLPRAMPATGPNDALNAPVAAPSLLGAADLAWAGEFRGQVSEIREALTTHCRLRGLMRFVRVPFWQVRQSGAIFAGDLRYHSVDRAGFAEIESIKGENCYEFEPPWVPPSGLFE